MNEITSSNPITHRWESGLPSRNITQVRHKSTESSNQQHLHVPNPKQLQAFETTCLLSTECQKNRNLGLSFFLKATD